MLDTVSFRGPAVSSPQLLAIDVEFNVAYNENLAVTVKHTASGIAQSDIILGVSTAYSSAEEMKRICTDDFRLYENEDSEDRLDVIRLLEQYFSSCRLLLRRGAEHGRERLEAQQIISELEAIILKGEMWLHEKGSGASLSVLKEQMDDARILFARAATILKIVP